MSNDMIVLLGMKLPSFLQLTEGRLLNLKIKTAVELVTEFFTECVCSLLSLSPELVGLASFLILSPSL